MQMLGFQTNTQIFNCARNFVFDLVAIIPDFHLQKPLTATTRKTHYEKYQVNGSHRNEVLSSRVEIGNYCHIFVREIASRTGNRISCGKSHPAWEIASRTGTRISHGKQHFRTGTRRRQESTGAPPLETKSRRNGAQLQANLAVFGLRSISPHSASG